MLVLKLKQFNNTKIAKSVKSNITHDVLYTLINSLWRIVSGPVTLVFIPLFLTSQTQGFWYTFISLAALTVFADLGFTTIVTQFSAHEYAQLQFNNSTGLFEGEEIAIKRIGSLFRFVVKWSLSVGTIGFPIILSVGFITFHAKNSNINWIMPWCIYILSSGLSFTTGTILSFFEGCGQIAAIEKNKFISAVISTVSTLSFLYLGFGLYALAFTSIIGALVNIILLYFRFYKLIIQILTTSKYFIINWKKDFLQLIWKYAISWTSGYFIFQIYTPLMFHFHGAVEAGKVGISVTLVLACFSIANIWMYVANPKLNMAASKKDWVTMDRLLKNSIMFSVITFISCASFIWLVLYFYSDSVKFLHRFLGLMSITMLFFVWLIQMVINGFAMYLRAHKEEPMMLISVIGAVYIFITTFLIAKYLPSQYLFLGILSFTIWGLPATIWIFIKKRKEWHS